jgi:hypothetical protein
MKVCLYSPVYLHGVDRNFTCLLHMVSVWEVNQYYNWDSTAKFKLALFTVVLNHSANWETLSVLHVCKFTLCLLQYKALKMCEWWFRPKHPVCQRSELYLKSLFLLHSKHTLSLTQPTHLNYINTIFKTEHLQWLLCNKGNSHCNLNQ